MKPALPVVEGSSVTLFSMAMVAADDKTEPPASNESWLRPRAWTPPDAAAAASGLVNCGTHQPDLGYSWAQLLTQSSDLFLDGGELLGA